MPVIISCRQTVIHSNPLQTLDSPDGDLRQAWAGGLHLSAAGFRLALELK